MDALDPFPPSDPLGEALHFLRMNGAFYCRSELTAPWGLTMPPMPGYVWFHVVTSGRFWLEAGESDSTWMGLGDLALVPHGEGHVLRSEPGATAPGILDLEREVVSDRYEILRHGDGGAPTGLICGAVRFEHPAARNLIEILPPTIHIEASSSPRLEWMQSMLRLMAAEAGELRPGRRGGDHAARRHPRDPGDPRLDGERPGRADRLARRAAGPADRAGDLTDPSRPGPGLDGRRRSPTSWRCRARRSPPASPSWSASR